MTTLTLTPEQRSALVDKLANDFANTLREHPGYRLNVGRHGFAGFANARDEELLRAHEEAFDEPFLEEAP